MKRIGTSLKPNLKGNEHISLCVSNQKLKNARLALSRPSEYTNARNDE